VCSRLGLWQRDVYSLRTQRIQMTTCWQTILVPVHFYAAGQRGVIKKLESALHPKN